jgi:signal transduction histidine kinase
VISLIVHSPNNCMSIKVLLVTFLLVLQILRQVEHIRVDEMLEESVRAGRLTVQQWINLANQPLQRFVRDFSAWPELAGFLTRRDPAWADTNLKQNLANYETHALWVLTEQGGLVYSAQRNAGPPLPPPFPSADFAPLTAAGAGSHFFAESRDGLLEVWCEPAGLNNQGNDPRGWLLVARLWNPRFLATLSRLADLNLHLAPANGPPAPESAQVRLLLPLRDLQGTTLRQLQAGLPVPDFAETLAGDTLVVRLVVLFGLLVIVSVWLSLQQWVLRPLSLITRSLAQGSAVLIEPIKREKTELGRVAQLVESSFAQKAALQNEIEEHKRTEAALRESEEAVRNSLGLRARLARDLHDGVIQSIYAAGLGLESALSQLESDPPGARTRLQLCRQSLNDIIRQVRGFINGIEPEQIQRQGFAQELAVLARTMEALWPVHIALQMDTGLARRLSARQEVHALQIVRECISNALRHGDAKEISITLNLSADRGILTIRDDGRGFDPEKSAGRGSGLLNLATRAREMQGGVRIASQPGHGAAVVIGFALTDQAL